MKHIENDIERDNDGVLLSVAGIKLLDWERPIWEQTLQVYAQAAAPTEEETPRVAKMRLKGAAGEATREVEVEMPEPVSVPLRMHARQLPKITAADVLLMRRDTLLQTVTASMAHYDKVHVASNVASEDKRAILVQVENAYVTNAREAAHALADTYALMGQHEIPVATQRTLFSAGASLLHGCPA